MKKTLQGRSSAGQTRPGRGLPASAMVVIYRRRQGSTNWEPWRAVSRQEALHIMTQPSDQELKLGEGDVI